MPNMANSQRPAIPPRIPMTVSRASHPAGKTLCRFAHLHTANAAMLD
jgi:hypothetical protein